VSRQQVNGAKVAKGLGRDLRRRLQSLHENRRPAQIGMGVCLRATMALFNSAPLSVDSSTIEQ